MSLLIKELAADVVFASQVCDGLTPSEDLDGQILPLLRQEPVSWPTRDAWQIGD
jgi:hypothetical protein